MHAEHIKQTLSTSKRYRYQQHLPKISQSETVYEVSEAGAEGANKAI